MWIYDRLTVSDHPLNFLEARSWGGGEIARFVGRHGTTRLSKMIFIGAVPPLMLKTDKNPAGLPLSVFDGLRSGIVENRSQFYKDISIPFYGYNEPNAKISEGIKEQFWRLGIQSSIAGSYDCVKAFSEDDFTQDLKKIDVPTFFIHGDADQIVPKHRDVLRTRCLRSRCGSVSQLWHSRGGSASRRSLMRAVHLRRRSGTSTSP